MSPLRRRLEQSKLLAAALSVLVVGYIRLCHATSRWRRVGFDALENALQDGPVVLIMWHDSILLAPSAWPRKIAPICTLRDPSPAGLLSAAIQARMGVSSVKMARNSADIGVTRAVISGLRAGTCLGLTADGPEGPARQAKTAPVDWARIAGRPVYLFAWSAPRAKRLKSWDAMKMPLPFIRGAMVYQRWQVDIPRRADAQEISLLQDALTTALNDVSEQAGQLHGK